ncbi:MAG: dockerin type I domain-containing protein [Bacteroidetes bacterium]|nr:dockerin type I domain-containing protein [Bacteroidota bacterium]
MKTATFLLAFLLFGMVNAQIPTDGLVAWYPLNGNANDESGNGNNGTVTGASPAADRFGSTNKAYYFNGIDNFIEIPNPQNLEMSFNDFSIVAWIKTNSTVNNGRIFSKGSSACLTGYMLRMGGPACSKIYIEIASGNLCRAWTTGTTSINNDLWHMVVCVVDRDYGLSFYVDNQPDGFLAANTSGYNLSNNRFPKIGYNDVGNAFEAFQGTIDDLRIFNRTLTSQEITALYNESPCPGMTGSSISGRLTYDNPPANSPLSCSRMYLKSSGGTIVDSTDTDLEGKYQFCGVTDGSYTLSANTTKTPGGINSGDALQALRHFIEYITLTGIRFKAADVNGNGYINSTDALLIGKRYIEYITTFPVGDWVFEEPTLNITEPSSQVVDFKGICVGDVNGSYSPPGCMNVPCPGIPFFEYEGQIYNTVLIRNQCWMKENLNVGTMINSITDQTNNSEIEKYCYDNDPQNCLTYGGLYQWNEMMEYTTTPGSQGICPADWHIPTDSEYCILTTFLDATVDCGIMAWSGTNAGDKMKETGYNHWYSYNNSSTNESGFTAIGAGLRTSDGNTQSLYSNAYFWSSTEYSSGFGNARILGGSFTTICRNYYYNSHGFSVRCLKN